MPRFLSYQSEPWQIFEVTTRCIQGRFLLRPGEEANRRMLGVIGRAQELFGEHVHLHMVAGTSNHLHLLVSSRDSAWRARFKHRGAVPEGLSIRGWARPRSPDTLHRAR